MPELPEVETVCRGLEKPMRGQVIKSITLQRGDLRIPFPPSLKKISNVRVKNISRRAKYILISLENGKTMIVHLGMSGSLVFHDKGTYKGQKHDHMILSLDNGIKVVLNDPRRFGLVDLTETKALAQHRFFKHLGPEPFDKNFTAAYLAEKIKSKKVSIKLAIMDQRVVVGVGNIYASEALYAARIDPRRAAGSLDAGEIKKLVANIQKTLANAIKAGGSSLRDYVQADGELGYFQLQWAVYGREGKKCKGCTCATGIQKIPQGGRSTFYCPTKQK